MQLVSLCFLLLIQASTVGEEMLYNHRLSKDEVMLLGCLLSMPLSALCSLKSDSAPDR